ncbi:MAG: hypothetical protein J7521_18170 [Caulobacter sp.]|nr:hypothetical protein [Caulobacter sp.]
MRTLSLALAALVGVTGAARAADTIRHEMPLDIPAPSRVEQVVRHIKEQTRDGKTESMWVETRSLATIDIDEKGEAYLVSLKLLDRKVSNPEIEPVLAATVPSELAYLADESLRPIKLADPQGVKARQVAFARKMAPQLGDVMEKMYANLSDEAFTGMLLKEQVYLSVGYNLGLKVGEASSYEGEEPSPFGGGGVKVRGTITLDSYDDKGKLAVVTWKETIDPESAVALGGQLAKQLTGKDISADLAKASDAAKAADLDISKGCRFEINTGDGLIRKADCQETVSAGAEGGKTERWAITQTLQK